MMTVQNPSGSPTIVYNRDGTTIESVTAAGTTQGGAAAIPRASGCTVALCTPSVGNDSVIMPSGAEIGDVVEVYTTSNATNLNIWPQSGGSLGIAATNAALQIQEGGRMFRYIGSGKWTVLGSYAS